MAISVVRRERKLFVKTLRRAALGLTVNLTADPIQLNGGFAIQNAS